MRIDDSASNIISNCDANEFFDQDAEVEYFVSPQNAKQNDKKVQLDQERIKIDLEKVDSSDDCETPFHYQAQMANTLKNEEVIISECLSQQQDLEAMVDDILYSRRHPSIRKEKKRRFKMSDDQAAILEYEFQANPNWTTPTYNQLCKRLDTTKARIYKWNWDRKRREVLGFSPSSIQK